MMFCLWVQFVRHQTTDNHLWVTRGQPATPRTRRAVSLISADAAEKLHKKSWICLSRVSAKSSQVLFSRN